MENKTIANILAEHIATYKKSHPNLSSQQIAKKFGVTSSSFNRIEKGDVSNPTIDQVIKILGGVGKHAEIVGYLSEYYPIINKTFREFYTTDIGVNSGDKIKHYLQKREYCLIILLALLGNGIHESDLKETFGKVGEDRLKVLLDDKVLSRKMNGIIGGAEDHIDVGSDVISRIGSIVVEECFNDDFMDKDLSYIQFRSFPVNRDTVMPQINHILRQTYDEIEKILSDEKNGGDYPMFYLLCTDSLYPKVK